MRSLALSILVLLLAGCSSSLETVTVPAGKSTVRTVPAETLHVPTTPMPQRGQPTEPFEVTISQHEDGPTLDVRWFRVDRRPGEGEIEVQYVDEGELHTDRHELIPHGMSWIWKASTRRAENAGTPSATPTSTTPDTTAPDTIVRRDTIPRAELRGEPQEREVEARVTDTRSWWERQWDRTINMLAAVGLLALVFGVGGLALRFTSLSLQTLMNLRKLSFWTVAALFAAGAIVASFGAAINAGLSEGWAGALSGYAAGLGSVVCTVAAAVAFDYFVLDNFDLLEELKDGNIAVALAFVGLLIAAALSFPAG